jgi:TolA-binding protein
MIRNLSSMLLETSLNIFSKNSNRYMARCRLGLAYHCLGNVRMKQRRVEEAIEASQLALRNFQAILGPKSFRVGQMYLKLAELHAEVGQARTARYVYRGQRS